MPSTAKAASQRLYPSTTAASKCKTTFGASRPRFGVGSTLMSANTSPTAAQPSAVAVNAPRSSVRPVTFERRSFVLAAGRFDESLFGSSTAATASTSS